MVKTYKAEGQVINLKGFDEEIENINSEETKNEPMEILKTINEEPDNHTQSVVDDAIKFKLTPLVNWVATYVEDLKNNCNVTLVQFAVSDVDSTNQVGFKGPNLKGLLDQDGNVKKEIFLIKDANEIKVIDLGVSEIQFFKNELFKIIHPISNNVYIKEYSTKTGPIIYFCVNIDGNLIPYYRNRMKRKDEDGIFIEPNLDTIKEKLDGPIDLEALQLLYKQSIKVKDKLTDMKTTIDWLLKRQKSAIDINHQILIDSVILSLFSY